MLQQDINIRTEYQPGPRKKAPFNRKKPRAEPQGSADDWPGRRKRRREDQTKTSKITVDHKIIDESYFFSSNFEYRGVFLFVFLNMKKQMCAC